MQTSEIHDIRSLTNSRFEYHPMDFLITSCDSYSEGEQQLHVIVDRNANLEIRGVEVFNPNTVLGDIFSEFIKTTPRERQNKIIKYRPEVDMLYIKCVGIDGKSIIQETAPAKPLLNVLGHLVGIKIYFKN